MKIRTISLFGYDVELWNFGGQWFYYPSFNGDAEFIVSSKGFKELRKYLRTCTYFHNIVKECERKLFN